MPTRRAPAARCPTNCPGPTGRRPVSDRCRPEDPLHSVMRCHVLSCEGRAMSCFVMFCMRTAHSLQSFRAWSRRFGPPLLTFHRGSPSFRFRHGSLLSARLHSVLPAARLPGAAGPCFAHNARRRLRARPRAFRGGASRAPDRPGAPARARGPSAGRTSPFGSSELFFRAGANAGGGAAPGMPLPSLGSQDRCRCSRSQSFSEKNLKL